jgi:RNA methyltransferase, TrmH family
MNATKSVQYAPLTSIRKLQCDRIYRDTTQSFYIEGVRNFIRACDQQLPLSTIFYSEKLLTAPLARKLVRQSRRSGISCLSVTPEQFRQWSHAERAFGVGAIATQPWTPLRDISPTAGLCWIVLDTVRSPGNFGTLIRTSESFGGAGFILLGNQIDPFSPDVVRASMGSIFCQTFIRTDAVAFQQWTRQHHCTVLGASPDGDIDLHRLTASPATVLFLGEERQGLTSTQRSLCQQLIRIPMQGNADSLNLAVAGSVMLYELFRSKLVS